MQFSISVNIQNIDLYKRITDLVTIYIKLSQMVWVDWVKQVSMFQCLTGTVDEVADVSSLPLQSLPDLPRWSDLKSLYLTDFQGFLSKQRTDPCSLPWNTARKGHMTHLVLKVKPSKGDLSVMKLLFCTQFYSVQISILRYGHGQYLQYFLCLFCSHSLTAWH